MGPLQVLMVLALVAAFAVPMLFGTGTGPMIAAHLCILTVSVAMFLGVLRLKKDDGPK